MKKESNLDIKQILLRLKKYGKKISKCLLLITFILIFGLYGFLILNVSSASQNEPSEEINTQISAIKRLKIDQQSIDKIENLEDQNVVVQSLFESARKDPFKE